MILEYEFRAGEELCAMQCYAMPIFQATTAVLKIMARLTSKDIRLTVPAASAT